MNIYEVSRNDNWDYDDWDAFVVVAPDENTARHTHPNGAKLTFDKDDRCWGWVDLPTKVDVKLIGTAIPGQEAGVVLGSFNAG